MCEIRPRILAMSYAAYVPRAGKICLRVLCDLLLNSGFWLPTGNHFTALCLCGFV
jgi:hypothetical protein